MNLTLIGIEKDEVAVKTSWEPVFKTAGNFRNLKLKRISSKYIRFVPTLGFISFALSFFILGSAIVLLTIASFFTGGISGPILLTILGVLFFTGGGAMIFLNKNYITFLHSKGKWRVSKESLLLSSPYLHSSSNFYAMQLLEKRIPDMEDPYNAYELNIIFDNGERENILNQGNYKETLKDAIRLSQYLMIPLWNGIGPPSSASSQKRVRDALN